jgi:hypothetical protein
MKMRTQRWWNVTDRRTPKYSEQYLSHCCSVHNKSRMDCAWERKRGLRGALPANKRLSQGTASMLNTRYKTVSVSLRNCQKTHSVSSIKTNYKNVSAQSGRNSPHKIPVCLCAKCPYISVQSAYVSTQSVGMSQREVSACLREKCPYVSKHNDLCLRAKCPYVSAHSVRIHPRKVPICLRAVSVSLRAKRLFLLSVFTQNRTLSTNFSKTPKCQVSQKIRPVAVELLDADGRTNRQDKVAFRQLLGEFACSLH